MIRNIIGSIVGDEFVREEIVRFQNIELWPSELRIKSTLRTAGETLEQGEEWERNAMNI